MDFGKKLNFFLNLLVVTIALTLIGFIADLTTIFSNELINKILKSEILKYIPYFLLLASTVLIHNLNQRLKNCEKNTNYNININNRLWNRAVRTLRANILDSLPTPAIKESLDPLMDELLKRLPENGLNFKISIAQPQLDGTFKILSSRGTDPASVHLLESKSNWKERKSFFSSSLLLEEEKPYNKYISGNTNYVNIQRATGIGTAKQHFTVVIKNNSYNDKTFPHNSLAVISIGIPPELSITDEEDQKFYNKIYPSIKSIEAIFLLNLINNKHPK